MIALGLICMLLTTSFCLGLVGMYFIEQTYRQRIHRTTNKGGDPVGANDNRCRSISLQ